MIRGKRQNCGKKRDITDAIENLMSDQIMAPREKCESGRKGGGEEQGLLAILENYLYCLVQLEMYFQSLGLSNLFKSTIVQVLPIQNLLCKTTKDSIKNSVFVQQVFT